MILIIYILAFIIQIVCLVKCIKNKLKWNILIFLEIISIITAMLLMNYYDSLPGSGFMPGLTYLGEVLGSFASMILYIAMLIITLIIKIIIFLINNKKQGKDYFPKIKFIIRIFAIIAVLIGIISTIDVAIHNYNTCKVSAIIVDNVEDEGWYHPVVQFDANGTTYTVTATNHYSGAKFSLDKEMVVYYNKNNPNELTNLYSNQEIVFIIGGSILFLISMIRKKANV